MVLFGRHDDGHVLCVVVVVVVVEFWYVCSFIASSNSALIHQNDGIFEPATFRANAHPATLGVGSEISGLDSSWTSATSRIPHPLVF